MTDAAVLLGAATGVDPNDAATAAQAGHAFTDYTQFLNAHALRGARIGVWRAGTFDPLLVGSVVDPILANVKSALEAQGATVVDPTDIDLSATASETGALLCEFKTDIATYLHTYVHGTNPASGGAVPADARRSDLVRPGAPQPRRALERRDLPSSRCDERPGRRLLRSPRRDHAARPGSDQRAYGGEPPRRDHRPDERPRLAEQRRPERG